MAADHANAAARNSAAQVAASERAVAEQRKAAAALFGPDPQTLSPHDLTALEERHRAALQRIHALQVRCCGACKRPRAKLEIQCTAAVC